MTQQNITYTKGSLLMNLSGQYTSEAYIDLSNNDDRVIPGYFSLNITVSYELTKNLSLTVRGNNITNTRYYTGGYVDGNGDNSYFIGAPINFNTTVNIKL